MQEVYRLSCCNRNLYETLEDIINKMWLCPVLDCRKAKKGQSSEKTSSPNPVKRCRYQYKHDRKEKIESVKYNLIRSEVQLQCLSEQSVYFSDKPNEKNLVLAITSQGNLTSGYYIHVLHAQHNTISTNEDQLYQSQEFDGYMNAFQLHPRKNSFLLAKTIKLSEKEYQHQCGLYTIKLSDTTLNAIGRERMIDLPFPARKIRFLEENSLNLCWLLLLEDNKFYAYDANFNLKPIPVILNELKYLHDFDVMYHPTNVKIVFVAGEREPNDSFQHQRKLEIYQRTESMVHFDFYWPCSAAIFESCVVRQGEKQLRLEQFKIRDYEMEVRDKQIVTWYNPSMILIQRKSEKDIFLHKMVSEIPLINPTKKQIELTEKYKTIIKEQNVLFKKKGTDVGNVSDEQNNLHEEEIQRLLNNPYFNIILYGSTVICGCLLGVAIVIIFETCNNIISKYTN
jgi:hypothetical protein